MWARGTRLRTAPNALSALIDEFTRETVPKLKGIPGNVGAVLLVARKEGAALALTYWKDKAALDASETPATALRDDTARKSGATVEDVQRFEIVMMERNGPPQAGYQVRSIQFGADRARLDEGVAYLRDTVTPQLRGIRGFRAAICGINREQGRGFISTVWETLADLQASEAAVAPLRQDTVQRFGVSDMTIEIFESAYVEIATTALTN
jgi:heme-degrading monooxygenase HmoA